LAYSEIAVRSGVTKGTVAYHARRLGIPADEKCARRYDWDAIQRAYDAGLTVRQCAARFGFNLASWHQAKERGDVVRDPDRCRSSTCSSPTVLKPIAAISSIGFLMPVSRRTGASVAASPSGRGSRSACSCTIAR